MQQKIKYKGKYAIIIYLLLSCIIVFNSQCERGHKLKNGRNSTGRFSANSGKKTAVHIEPSFLFNDISFTNRNDTNSKCFSFQLSHNKVIDKTVIAIDDWEYSACTSYIERVHNDTLLKYFISNEILYSTENCLALKGDFAKYKWINLKYSDTISSFKEGKIKRIIYSDFNKQLIISK